MTTSGSSLLVTNVVNRSSGESVCAGAGLRSPRYLLEPSQSFSNLYANKVGEGTWNPMVEILLCT